MTTSCSNHQMPLLRYFVGHVTFMSIEQAMAFDQRAFRSFLIRKWIAFRPGFGFHLTPEGRQAWDLFQHTEIRRTDPTRPLTRYFNYLANGFEDPRTHRKPRARVHVMRKTA